MLLHRFLSLPPILAQRSVGGGHYSSFGAPPARDANGSDDSDDSGDDSDDGGGTKTDAGSGSNGASKGGRGIGVSKQLGATAAALEEEDLIAG